MERFIAIGCVAAGLVTTPVAAQAADAVRPVYRAPLGAIYDWTGFYVGGHIGFISTDSDSGFLGGGQAGFNYQVGQWVFGVEGQMSATSIKESAVFVVPGVVARAEGSLDWVSTFAGRAGFAFDQWLVYGKLGAAWAHGSASASVMGPIGGASISVSKRSADGCWASALNTPSGTTGPPSSNTTCWISTAATSM
jgi:Outer membrane protein beta-barrel domain